MLNSEFLKQILIDQHRTILKKEFGIAREVLMGIKNKLELPHILVITGLRRCGKSTLLRQIIKHYYKDKDFYFLNFEDERFLGFEVKYFNQIYETLIELFGDQKIFFIDEIQNVENFENFVRRFHDDGFKFIITGSNAKLLSRELGTKLTGRHLDITLFPFSFYEFLQYKQILIARESIYSTTVRAIIKSEFGEYLKDGGMPEYIKFKDPEILTRVYEDIVLKDIIVRHRLDNIKELRELYQYIISNFAQRYSYNSLKKSLNISSVTTISKYLQILQDTYFGRNITKYDHSFKVQVRSKKKFYLMDNGFIPLLSMKLIKDKGWLLESLVFNELLKKGEVYYYSNGFECDFVLVSNNSVNTVIQVTMELDSNNRDREIKGLIETMKIFNLKECLILCYDREDEIYQNDYEIQIKPVWKWLLENKINQFRDN